MIVLVRRLAFVLAIAVLLILIALFLLLRSAQPETNGIDQQQYQGGKAADGSLLTVKKTIGQRPPNIVIVLADDLGYGDVSSQGNGIIQTPHIDALATQGMRFTDFYSSMPVCSPSRAGLLTGRYPPRSGFITAAQAADDSFKRKLVYRAAQAFAQLGVVDMRGGGNMVAGLPADEITIAELLKAANYKTGAFGKWHLGDFTREPAYHPQQHGFDEFVGFNMSNDDWPVAFWEGQNEKVEDIGLNQEHYTQVFTDAAIDFMQRNKDEPFFVYLAQKDPHQPFYPSEPFKGKSDAGPYGDAVAEFDWSAGAVADALVKLGLDNNTLLIVTSDNGPWYQGHSGGLRGRKGQTYEGGFRVPMVAWWPGTIEAGSIADTPAMNIDFLPTAAALAGVELPTDRTIDGQNLTPLIEGQATAELAQRELIYFDDYDAEGIRIGDWKLLTSHNSFK